MQNVVGVVGDLSCILTTLQRTSTPIKAVVRTCFLFCTHKLVPFDMPTAQVSNLTAVTGFISSQNESPASAQVAHISLYSSNIKARGPFELYTRSGCR